MSNVIRRSYLIYAGHQRCTAIAGLKVSGSRVWGSMSFKNASTVVMGPQADVERRGWNEAL